MNHKPLAITLLFSISIYLSMYSQMSDDPQFLLEQYINTGEPGFIERISEIAPGSKYEKFCKTWELLDVDNKTGIAMSRELVTGYPEFPEAHFALGTFLINGTKHYDSAIIALDKAIELKKDFALAYFHRGIGKINNKQYESAKLDFAMTIQLERGYAGAYVMRAVSNFYLNIYDDLLGDIEIALQMDPYIISDLYYFQVRKTMDKAIEIAPDNVNLYYGRGFANFMSGYYRLAANDFNKALELVPGNAEYYKMLGASKIYIKDEPGAESDLKVAMGINPDDPDIYYYLGILASDVQDQPEMGYEYFTHAIDLNPEESLYYYERGWASYELYEFYDAFDDAKRALEIDDKDGDYYALRGYILVEVEGEFETELDYCDDFKKAEELGTMFKLKKVIKKYCEE